MQHGIPGGVNGLLHVHDRRQGVVFDLDQAKRVFRDIARFRHHHGHRLADMPDLLDGDAMLDDRRRAEGRHRPGPVGKFPARQHQKHPGKRLGLRGVDRKDAGMGMRAWQDRRMGHARQVQVIGEPAPARQQAQILAALDGSADPA